MRIIPGCFYHCIDPAAPMYGARVEVTQRIAPEFACTPERVCFICEGRDTLRGWVFSQALGDFEKNFVEWPPAPVTAKHGIYHVERRP